MNPASGGTRAASPTPRGAAAAPSSSTAERQHDAISDQRAAGRHHRRGVRHGPQPRPAAVRPGLAGGHRRRGRGRAQGHRGVAGGSRAHPGPRRARRGRPGAVRRRGPRVAAGTAGRGVQQRRRRGHRHRPFRGTRGRRLAVRHQLPRRGERYPRVPADPRRAGRRRDRQHLQRVRVARGAVPERVLRGEVRRAGLERGAAPGVSRHRGPRGDRASRRGHHEQREQRPQPVGSAGPRPHQGAAGGAVRGRDDDHARPGGADHRARRRARPGTHPRRTRRVPVRRARPHHADALLRRARPADATAAVMTEHVDVLIIGAGLSGIGAAHHIQSAFPDRSYAILEARDTIGGTWDLFRYPGVRSDSDMHTLGYRFRPWTQAKAIADGAAHVTMLQRSPTYVLTVPAEDPVANGLRCMLGARRAYPIGRWKNITISTLLYQLSRRRPRMVRPLLRRAAIRQLPDGYAVDTHFQPRYQPWDQRLCLVPDGDLFTAISAGRASMVTDRIARFPGTGLPLASGAHLDADIVVTATGLRLLAIGGIELAVDGRPVSLPQTMAYKGMMLSGVPNFAFTIGYTNASWTLKADLVSGYVVRLLRYLDAHGYDQCVPTNDDPTVASRPLLDFQAGYVLRAIGDFPRAGSRAPWRLGMSYLHDLLTLRHHRIDDGAMRFARRPATRSVISRPA